MAATIAEVSTPSQAQSFGTIPPFKFHIVDVTADASYPTGGYLLTPANLSLSALIGAIVIGPGKNAAGTLSSPVTASVVAATGNLAVQFFASNGVAPAQLAEEANTTDLHLFTTRLLVLGY